MMKKCKKCEIEKELTIENFIYRKKGDYWEHTCRICQNKRRKELSKKTSVISKENNSKGNKVSNIEKKEPSKFNLSLEQSKKILILIDNADKIIDLVNNKIEINVDDKANRTIKSINLDNNLFKSVKENSTKLNISISDMINLLIKKGLEFL